MELFYPQDLTSIKAALQESKGIYAYENSAAAQNSGEINSLFRELDASVHFFRYLGRPDREADFQGSLHCESCLASLITPNSDHGHLELFKDLAVRNRVFLSKRINPHACS